MPRLDPSVPDAPRISMCVPVAAEQRVLDLAAERGVSKSAAAREILLAGLSALDAERGPPERSGG